MFMLLWAGQSLALLSDAFYIMALVTMLYAATGTAMAAALVPIVRVAALFTGGVLAPVALGRYPLLAVMRLAQAAQWLFLLLATVLSVTDLAIAWLLVPLALSSLADGWIAPARQSLVPRLVPSPLLVRANGWLAATDQGAQLAGWAAGGALVALMGGERLLWFSLVLQGISSASAFLLREDSKGTTDATSVRGWAASIALGWKTIIASRGLRTVAVSDFVEGSAGGVWAGAIMLAFVRERLGRGEDWWGYLNAAYLVGTLAGSMLVLASASRIERSASAVIVWSAAAAGLCTAAFGLSANPWIAASLCLVLGPPTQAMEISKRTLVQRASEAETLPAVLSASGCVAYASFGLSVLAMGAVSDRFGAVIAYGLASVLLLFSALYSFLNRSALRL